MSVAIAFSVNAQTKKAPHHSSVAGAKKVQLFKKVNFIDNQKQFATTFNGAPALLPATKDVNVVNKVLISHSLNPNSYLVSQQTVMSSNNDLGLITFTARKSATNIIPGSTTNASGVCQTSFSVNGGASWDTTLVPWRGTENATSAGRYPSGVIYNPTGNTTVANAYAVVSGPKLTGNAAPWLGSFFASESFAKTNNNMQANVGPLDTIWARNYLQSCDGGTFHVIADHNNDNGTIYTYIESVKFDGSWNGTTNSVDWTTSSHVPPFTVATDASINGYARASYAWSKDGQIGYHIYVGQTASASDPLAYAPIVYKTTDAGATWNLMAGFDFSTIPAVAASLTATSTPGISRAYYTDPLDAVVDANNNLHIASYIYSASSNSVDSTGYIWTFASIEGYMFDTYTTTATGGWNANYIDTQYGKDLAAADDAQWGLGWDNRFQISKSPDATKLFYIWSDSDTLNITTDYMNRYPDIIALGYDVNTGLWTNAGIATNFTKGGIYDGSNFFMNASDWTFKSGSTYTLHVSTETCGATGTDPVDHYYLTGITFTDADFPVGVSEVSNGITTVSQNYPNPTNGTTTIDVNLAKSAKLGMVVTNLMGQKVYEVAANTVAAGTHTLSIDASNLSSGVYFYTVTADNSSITKKMIVE